MINFFNNRTRKIFYIIFPVAVAIYIIYPLLAGYYAYPVAEYGIYKSFMSNFIDSLRKGVLPVWNEYVGCGHPAMYFGHYPISQNTLIYILFGFSDFTYYLTRCLNLVILLFAFIYASKYLKFSYWIGLLGALCYFSINFVSRILIAETIGNLILVYPLLVVLIMKIIQEYKIKDVLFFSLVYIFWLLGGHIIYVYMHLIMLSVIFWITAFVFYGYNTFRFKNLLKFISLYLLLFALPFLAVLYQYYFVYDVIAASNRLKEGLIVSPFKSIAWKQLLESFKSSSYIFMGLILAVVYWIMRGVGGIFGSLRNKKIGFSWVFFFSILVSLIFCFPDIAVKLFHPPGVRYQIVNSSNYADDYTIIEEPSTINSVIAHSSVNDWKDYLSIVSCAKDKKFSNLIKLTTTQNATGYICKDFDTKPGSLYRFSVFYKQGSADNAQIKIGLSADDTSIYYSGVLSNKTWKRYSTIFEARNPKTYVTLVNLTSTSNKDSYFAEPIINELNPAPISDYAVILKSGVFRVALILFFILTSFIFYTKRHTIDLTFFPALRMTILFIVYISLISHYLFSPANIDRYDYELFTELSFIFRVIFIFCVLNSMKLFKRDKYVKIIVISMIVLYLLRSHLLIPLFRFTGILWYPVRDGSIFSLFFAVLFMFGAKHFIYEFSIFLKNKYIALNGKYWIGIFVLLLAVGDSYNKFYHGTSHRFIFPTSNAKNAREKNFIEGRKDIVLLEDKMRVLSNKNNHFFRIFTLECYHLYLAGNMQQYKIHQAAMYESSVAGNFMNFFDYTILARPAIDGKNLESILPCPVFTKHIYAGFGVADSSIPYGKDIVMYFPSTDAKYLKNQNIEFFWDIAQVQYLILGPTLSKALESFDDYYNYKLIQAYPGMQVNLYEITKPKNYSKLALYPLENGQDYNELIKNLNSNDINVLKGMYSKLIFLDQKNNDFNLLQQSTTNDSRYYEIEAKKPGILIDFESWNHNWQLVLNNKKQTLDKSFQIFKAIKLNPGINKINLKYSLKYFKGLFVIGNILILLYILSLTGIVLREKNTPH